MILWFSRRLVSRSNNCFLYRAMIEWMLTYSWDILCMCRWLASKFLSFHAAELWKKDLCDLSEAAFLKSQWEHPEALDRHKTLVSCFFFFLLMCSTGSSPTYVPHLWDLGASVGKFAANRCGGESLGFSLPAKTVKFYCSLGRCTMSRRKAS